MLLGQHRYEMAAVFFILGEPRAMEQASLLQCHSAGLDKIQVLGLDKRYMRCPKDEAPQGTSING